MVARKQEIGHWTTLKSRTLVHQKTSLKELGEAEAMNWEKVFDIHITDK